MEDVTSGATQVVDETAASSPATETQENTVNEGAEPSTETQTSENTGETKGAEPSGAEKRIKELNAKRKESEERARKAEETAAYYKGLAEGRKAAETHSDKIENPSDEVEPNIDNYTSEDAWRNDVIKFQVRQELKQVEVRRQEETRYAEEAKSFETFKAKIKAAEDKYPDFKEVTTRQPSEGGPIITREMVDVMRSTDLGTDIAYYLGKNPQVSARIAAMPPMMAARELGLIEAKIQGMQTAAQPNKKTSAPSPITTLSGTGSVSKRDMYDETLTTEERIKLWNERAG